MAYVLRLVWMAVLHDAGNHVQIVAAAAVGGGNSAFYEVQCYLAVGKSAY